MSLKIYTAKFGENNLRFVLLGGDLFVSRGDLVVSIKQCSTDYVRPVIDVMVDKWLKMACDMSDKRGAIIGESSIGQVIHFHAVGNMLDALSSFNDSPNDEMRETGYRIRTLFLWYADAIASANEELGIAIGEMLSAVKSRLDRISPPFIVRVIHDGQVWIAENDELGLVTEAETYEALTERVWQIAPELYEMNGFGTDAEDMRISFIQEQSAEERLAL